MSIPMRALGAAFACVLACVPAAPSAQTPTAAPAAQARPKIGLVLSGGGARGAAHIGVLKVLEELRVPVDVIAGTSMGSIVGASYASGMTVPEMEEAIARITFQQLFTDTPPRQDAPMRIKADDFLPLASPQVGISREGVSLPKGVISGVALEAELRSLVRIRGFRKFDDLPIPFRAVATNLGDGRMYVFDRGELPMAMRASMAVPGLVAPLSIDGNLLVDGGLVRNLPVDIARAMGADVIIAVNLGTPLLKPEQIDGLFGVSMQMINILTEQNVGQSLAQLTDDDVLILPELGNFSSGDFDNLIKTVPIGEAGARKMADKLRRYALPPAEYAALRARQAAPPAGGGPVIAKIVVEGNKRVSQAVIAESMRTRAGEPVDQDTLDADMRRIYGRGDFEAVRPDVREENGENVLVVNVSEKSWGPAYGRFGLELEANLGKQSRFDLLGSFRWTWLNSFGAEWRNDIALGNSVIWSSSFYQPLSEKQYFFVEPRLLYSNTPYDLYIDNQRVAEFRDKVYGVGFDVGANFIRFGEARIGAFYGRRAFTLEAGPLLVPEDPGFAVGLAYAGVRIDQLDSISFTRSGYFLSADLESSRTELGAVENYNKYELQGRGALSYGRHSLQMVVRGGGSLGGNELPDYANFQLGGFLNMSGYAQGQLLGPRYLYGRIGYLARIAEIPLFEGAYAGAAFEVLRMPQLVTFNQERTYDTGTLYVGVDTPLGVLYLGYGYADSHNTAVYLYLGKPF